MERLNAALHKLTSSSVPRRSLGLLLAAIGSLGASYLVVNVLTFGGDPEIHMVFGKNLLDGYPLQFNRGEYSSGETSPLYSLIIAAAIACFGDFGAAIFMKALGVASALILLMLMHEVAVQAVGGRARSLAFGVAIAAAPFFFFQAQLGMENMLFALGVAWVLRGVLRQRVSARRHVGFVAIAHAVFWIRPEAVFLIAFLYYLGATSRDSRWPKLAASLPLSVLLVCVYWVLQDRTGVPLFAAGSARASLSQLDSVQVPGLRMSLNPKPLVFFAYAWPLLLAMASGRRALDHSIRALCAGLVGLPLLLHLINVFPNAHFLRYSLYWWFPLLLAASRAVSQMPTRSKTVVTWVFSANCALTGLVEAKMRWDIGTFFNTRLLDTYRWLQPDVRDSFSDQLAELANQPPPVVVAAQEVQVRLRLDDRFVVRSLDGIVDPKLLRFVTTEGVDHVGYLEHRGVRLVLDCPAHGIERSRSLDAVWRQSFSGSPVTVGCSRFTLRRLAGLGGDRPVLVREDLVPCPHK